MEARTLEEVLWHIHNWFDKGSASFYVKDCEVVGGELPQSLGERIREGTWYRIEGSYLNDGLHLRGDDQLEDETFDATVTVLRIPKALLAIVEDIDQWLARNGEAADSPYASESFGGYSYTLKGGIAPSQGAQGLSGWRLAFRDRLSPWRRL